MAWRIDPGPFGVSGHWYRACLHAHTTESDGAMPPPRLLQHYALGGFDVLAITDHEKLTIPETESPPGLLALPGTEMAVGRSEAGQPFHVVGLGIARMPERRPDMTVQDVVDAISAEGGVAIVAHPYWSGLTVHDLLGVDGYLAIEVYNTGCEMDVARGYAMVHWDDLLSRGRDVRAVASDDTHYPGHDSLGGWTMIRAAEPTAAAVTIALRAGHFYASTGPVIRDVQVDGNTLYVACSPAARISLVGDPRRGAAAGVRGTGYPVRWRRPVGTPRGDDALLEEATFELIGSERYVRVQVADPAGHLAWTNPVLFG